MISIREHLKKQLTVSEYGELVKQILSLLIKLQGEGMSFELRLDKMQIQNGKLCIQTTAEDSVYELNYVKQFIKDLTFATVFGAQEECQKVTDFMHFLDNKKDMRNLDEIISYLDKEQYISQEQGQAIRQPMQQAGQQPIQQVEPPMQQAGQHPIQSVRQQPMQQAEQQPMQQAERQLIQPAGQQPMQQAGRQLIQPAEQQPMQQAERQLIQPAGQQPMQQAGRQLIQPAGQQPMQQAERQLIQPVGQQPMQQAGQQPIRQPIQQPANDETGVLDISFWQNLNSPNQAAYQEEVFGNGKTCVLDPAFWETALKSTPSTRLEREPVQNRVYGRLVHVKTGQQTMIHRDYFWIGKEGVDLQIEKDVISRRHAVIVCQANHFFISDNDSTNKTYVDNKEIPPKATVEIFNGTRLKFANEEYIFQL